MLHLLRTTWYRWQRQRRAARLRRELHAIGYTPAELEEMASLSAMYQEAGLLIGRGDAPPHQPTLADVLQGWPS